MFYFDLEDKKTCKCDQFKKGLDKFGCNFKEHELKALFDKYSNGEELNYEEFVKGIMDIDINGMISKNNLLTTNMGTHHRFVQH